MNPETKQRIQSTFKRYHRPACLADDPLCVVRMFAQPADWEMAGLVAAVLAYGRVEQIIAALNRIFEATGKNLSAFVFSTTYGEKTTAFAGIKHRFNDSVDFALLFEGVKQAYARHGSLNKLFLSYYKENHSASASLMEFAAFFRTCARAIFGREKKSFAFLFPCPSAQSACKRLHLFLRWMVRKDDGIDLGLWKGVPASALLIPVDTHIARAARLLGLTKRSAADWTMAEEITAELRTLDPHDPIKYDFALCTAGKMGVRP